jgi:D-beta-D-heptose 7-phosphate kinase / D-beta-D-heptose 1-phosphate adenosyltransferase
VSARPLVVVGDVLLDREVIGTVDRLCPEAPVPVLVETSTMDRPGGAGLAALLAAGGGREVVLIGAFSADEAGDLVRELLTRAGVRVVALPLHGPTPEKIRLRAGEHLLLRVDRGEATGTIGGVPPDAPAALRAASAILVSDYGRGMTAVPQLRLALAGRAHAVPVVWDPHPRGERPVPAVRLVTPNRGEATSLLSKQDSAPGPNGAASSNGANGGGSGPNGGGNGPNDGSSGGNGGNGGGSGGSGADGRAANGFGPWSPDAASAPDSGAPRDQRELASAAAAAVRLRRYWAAGAVAVTLAERGAVLSDGVSPPMLLPAPFAARGDSCGAGDRFASAALTALAGGAMVVDAVASAVQAATAFVAAGGALALRPPAPEDRAASLAAAGEGQ